MTGSSTPRPRLRGVPRMIQVTRLATAGILVTLGAVAVLPVAALTLCRARRLYIAWARHLTRAALAICGVRVEVHHEAAWNTGQTVFISNHPSTLDLFVLVALGMPNARFFLAAYLKKFLAIGILARLMGTFFTVPQEFQAERVRIFRHAAEELRRTGESVYLSPEGERVTGGRIGPFNKGSFHLATSLRAPIQPMYFFVPPDIDPETGFDIRPGTFHVYVKPIIETRGWRVEDVARNRDAVLGLFTGWHRAIREAHGVTSPAVGPC
jgi:1-acyl-sn-glycerol-3-phosphate acyltransferase